MSYSGKLGRRRYEGYAEQHYFTALSTSARAKRIGGVAAPKAPHRPIEGAHLRPMVTLDQILDEYREALGED